MRAGIELSIYVKFLEKERTHTENYRSRPAVAWYWGRRGGPGG